jgi:hypothetical protein
MVSALREAEVLNRDLSNEGTDAPPPMLRGTETCRRFEGDRFQFARSRLLTFSRDSAMLKFEQRLFDVSIRRE